VVLVVCPGGVLVVGVWVVRQPWKDAHEAVAELALRAVVPGAPGAELVVVGPRAG
jgi:hypothetical protein